MTSSRPYGGLTVAKKKPVEPQWHKDLKAIATLAAAYKPIGAPEVIACKNLCRRLKAAGTLISWELLGTSQVYKIIWVARDKQWSGAA